MEILEHKKRRFVEIFGDKWTLLEFFRMFLAILGEGTAETVSHCILNKQITSASSYIICLFSDLNCLIKSLATFGLTQQGAVYVQGEQLKSTPPKNP